MREVSVTVYSKSTNARSAGGVCATAVAATNDAKSAACDSKVVLLMSTTRMAAHAEHASWTVKEEGANGGGGVGGGAAGGEGGGEGEGGDAGGGLVGGEQGGGIGGGGDGAGEGGGGSGLGGGNGEGGGEGGGGGIGGDGGNDGLGGAAQKVTYAVAPLLSGRGCSSSGAATRAPQPECSSCGLSGGPACSGAREAHGGQRVTARGIRASRVRTSHRLQSSRIWRHT